MGTASVKSTATPPKGCGPMCATSFVRSKGFIRRTWLATLPCVNSDAISNVSRPLSLLNWLPFTLFTHEPRILIYCLWNKYHARVNFQRKSPPFLTLLLGDALRKVLVKCVGNTQRGVGRCRDQHP